MDIGQMYQRRLELSESPSMMIEEQEKWRAWQQSQPLPRVPTGEELIESGFHSALKTAGRVGSLMTEAPFDLVKGLLKGGVSQVLQTGHDITRLGENVAQIMAPTPAGALKMRKHAIGTGPGSITEPVGTVQSLAHPAGQFLVDYLPAMRGLKAVGVGSKTAGALAGFAADFAGDPDAGNLANVAGDIYGAFSPEGQSALVEWLGTNKESSELTNRLRNAFIGSATGLTFETAMAGARMLRQRGQMNRLGQVIKEAYAEAGGQRGAVGRPVAEVAPKETVYHGTTVPYDKYEGEGIWVSSNPKHANVYSGAQLDPKFTAEGANVRPYEIDPKRLNLATEKDLGLRGNEDVGAGRGKAREMGFDGVRYNDGTMYIFNAGKLREKFTGESATASKKTLYRHGKPEGEAAYFGQSEGEVAMFQTAGPLHSLDVEPEEAARWLASNILKSPNAPKWLKDLAELAGNPEVEYILPSSLFKEAKEHY